MFLFGGGSFTIKVATCFPTWGLHQPPYMISKVAGGRGGVSIMTASKGKGYGGWQREVFMGQT